MKLLVTSKLRAESEVADYPKTLAVVLARRGH